MAGPDYVDGPTHAAAVSARGPLPAAGLGELAADAAADVRHFLRNPRERPTPGKDPALRA